jgi:hypothetical protein
MKWDPRKGLLSLSHESQEKGPGNRRGLRLLKVNYQLRRTPNWNWRGSNAAVGVPAWV